MQLFVRGIPESANLSEIEKYFAKYGEIAEFYQKGRTGFLVYEDQNVANHVAKIEFHKIKNYVIYTDFGRERQFQRNDSGRDGCNFCSMCPIHGNSQGQGSAFNKQKVFYHQKQGDRQPFKKNDHLKIVVENIPSGSHHKELKDFARHFGLEVVFARTLSDNKSALLEFRTIEEKNIAIEKLNNQDMYGNKIMTRNYHIHNEDEAVNLYDDIPKN